MRKHLLSICLLGMVILLGSCSAYDRVAVWYKYRKDFRVHPVTSEVAAQAKLNKASAKMTPLPAPAQTVALEINDQKGISPSKVLAQISKDLVKDNPTFTSNKHKVAKSPSLSKESRLAHTSVARKIQKEAEYISSAQQQQGSGKSQLVAALLSFFLGVLGIHRFYLGYIWQGVVQLLTLGGCGLWAFIDFIRILLGDLGPKDGTYSSTFEDM